MLNRRMQIKFAVTIVILFLLGCGGGTSQDYDIYQVIDGNRELSTLSGICPSELIQNTNVNFTEQSPYCASNSKKCLERCIGGSANHCFGLADHLNVLDDGEKYSGPLYAKSCQLGLVSGCTNVAAEIKRYQGLDKASCYTQTFEKTCALKDPWGCTMYAVSLVYGEGVDKNTEFALEALKGSCRFGESDRACSDALELTKMIEQGDFKGE